MNEIKKGLIVSIQGYSVHTTQELADHAIQAGAVAIRTDKPIDVPVPIIGLAKLQGKKYYITTSIEAIQNVSRCTNFVAIDSRKGNVKIKELYDWCTLHSLDIIADIGTFEDVQDLFEKGTIPDYICTTFSFMYNEGNPDIELIRRLKEITTIPIIAEGGFYSKQQVVDAFRAGANALCIGKAISKIFENTEDYIRIIHDC